MSNTPAPAPASTPSQTPAASTGGRPSNPRHNYRGRRTTSSFTPKLSKIESLASSSENKSQDFSKFQKSLHHHVLTTFKNSKDLSKAILEFADPLVAIRQHIPSLTAIRTRHNLVLQGPPTGTETDTNKFIRESENNDRTDTAKIVFSNEVKLIAERERDATQNLTILWATIMGQCTPALQEEVQGEPDYGAKSTTFDSVWLLQTLQKITAGVNKTTNKYFSVFKATKNFYSTQQGFNESLDDYYGRFEAAKDLVLLFDADILNIDDLLVKEKAQDATATKDTVMQKFLALGLVMNANRGRYESLWNKLENDLLVGIDSYPVTIGAATHLLTNWKPTNSFQRPRANDTDRNSNGRNTDNPPVSFAQVPLPADEDFSALPGYDSSRPNMAPSRKPPHNISEHVTCTRCQKKGHYATACPFIIPRPAAQLCQVGAHEGLVQLPRASTQLNQVQTDVILTPGCIIVDSGSTFNCFRDASLLTNVNNCEPFSTFSNGGGMTYSDKGAIKMFPYLQAYHHPNCLVNIISLDLLQEKYHTRFDSATKNAFMVDINEDITLTFAGFGSGLYFYNSKTPVASYPVTFLNTVPENKQFFTRQEIRGAELAREQQGQIGWPSDQEYYEIIRDNLIHNSKATLDDLRRAEYIYGGPAVNLLKGKTFYTPVNTGRPIERVPLPPHILKTHPSDNLDIDFMYVQGAPYLYMKTTTIKFQAIQSFNKISRKDKNNAKRITYKRGPKDIITSVEKVLGVVRRRGFEMNTINADNEFQKLENKVSAHVEICAAGQHVPRIERGVRSVKDRTRCRWVALPFKKAPKIMVDECLIDIISCLNDFPAKNGISKTIGPAAIVLGRGKKDGNHLKGTFGRYYEVYCGTDNTNKERRVSAICLRPSNNQGGYYFMSLESGRKIHGFKFTELAMPQHVIDRVHELAQNEGAEELDEDGCPIFEWEVGNKIRELNEQQHNEAIIEIQLEEEDQDDEVFDEQNNEEADVRDHLPDNHANYVIIEESDDDDSIMNMNINEISDEESLSDNISRSSEENSTLQEIRSEGSIDDEDEDDEQSVSSSDSSESDSSIDTQEKVRSEINEENIVDGPRTRPRRQQMNIKSVEGKTYGVNMFNIEEESYAQFTDLMPDLYSKAVGICFTQMTASKGIKLIGQPAVAAMFKEFKQLVDLQVLGTLNPDELTDTQKKKALRAINLIKVKRCGKVKGRTCADGSGQRKYVPREEAASPTLSLESLMSLLLISAHEERDTAVFDVPGAYLHADIPGDKFVILKVEGEFVDIMCQVNPEFTTYVRRENQKKVLYLQILKALYGMIESALLWYSLYTEILQSEGFELNPYDRCVANKMIDGKQCTLGWYVDDNFLSHKDTKVVDKIIEMVESHFPGLSVERGKKLNFLGMEIEFTNDKKVKLGTKQYIQSTIEELEESLAAYKENLNKEYSCPAGRWLFKLKEDEKPITEDKADLYRSFVAKLLWIMKRSRPDLELAVSFLSTRVKAPTKSDWHKFLRVMCWLKQTKLDVRVIGADDLVNMVVMIDSAHAVHDNMRGHTGGVTSFGTGIIDQKSSKQKMNTRSSTETEHVGTSEYLPKPIFLELFMGAQGYSPNMVLCKDNESEIRMLLNGKASCTSNSKHVDIKYFWSTDRIRNGSINVKHCPTDKMIADFMSKPVQGKLFNVFREVIMGWKHISVLFDALTPAEERVGNNGVLTAGAKKPKMTKLTYAEVAKVSKAVEVQNAQIGGDETLTERCITPPH